MSSSFYGSNPNDTIVACATPAGYSSIAVIRLSGPNAVKLTQQVFRINEEISAFQSRHAYYGRIVHPEGEKTIDQIIATFYLTPQSYTGEDVVELSCHGNPLIVDQIIKILIGLGARLAQRGEFTKRALLSGKIDLLQAEAVLDTIYAPCLEAQHLAVMQYEGRLSKMVYDLKAKLVDLLTIVEADIDFSENEDIPFDDAKLIDDIRIIIKDLDAILAGAEMGKKIREGYKILIIGRANVGKSTLFNRIIGYDRAIIHERPGTTRDYLEEGVEIAGLYTRLFDTAGFIEQCDGPDAIAQKRSHNLIETADLILLMFDGTEPLNEEDVNLFNLTRGKELIMVVNKIDLNIRLNNHEILSDSVKISAKSGQNLEELIEAIKEHLRPGFDHEKILITRQRHVDAIEKVKQYLLNTTRLQSLETIAFELHCALDTIGELTGKVTRKEIIDRIFDEFCVGK